MLMISGVRGELAVVVSFMPINIKLSVLAMSPQTSAACNSSLLNPWCTRLQLYWLQFLD